LALVLLLSCCMLSSPSRADPEDTLHEVIKKGAAQLLEQGELAEYDRQASALRASHELTPAGIWKLYLFYKGVDHIAPDAPGDPVWTRVEAGTQHYLADHPDSPTALIARVRVLLAHADALRSAGGQSGYDTAAARTEEARELLERYRAMGSADPDWYVDRIVALNSQGRDKHEVLALVREALEREPTYQPLLYVASNALLPGSGGSRALHEQFVELALQRSRAALGTQAYARIMFNIARLDPKPVRALDDIGMSWPRLRASLAEVSAAYPDSWNLNAERAMTCLVGTEADLRSATARTPQPLYAVVWYDRYVGWPECESRQLTERAPFASGLRSLLGGGSVSSAFLGTVTLGVLTVLAVLAVARRRAYPADAFQRRDAGSARSYPLTRPWKIGQVLMGGVLGVLGLAGVWGFGVVAEFHDSTPALCLVFGSTLLAAGGVLIAINAAWYRVVLCDDVLEVQQLWGVRRLARARIASRQGLVVQGMRYIVFRFKDSRRNYKLGCMFTPDAQWQAFLDSIPDADVQARNALEAEVREDARLGSTPQERLERFTRINGYLRYAMYSGPLLFFWSAVYPHPYLVMIAALALLPWAWLIACKFLPGVFQIGGTNQLRPDLLVLMLFPVAVLALRAMRDVHMLDWHPALPWMAGIALALGLAFIVASAGQPRRWPVLVFVCMVSAAYGYGTSVLADAVFDGSPGESYRTNVLARHSSGGRSPTYSLSVGPWGDRAGGNRVEVPFSLYAHTRPGEEVCIAVRPGALAVAWYDVQPCSP
jgi:hypothetical protein